MSDPGVRKKKILAIDDEPDVLALLKMLFESNGFEAVTAPNGTEGLIRAHVEQPDLILLDIMMEEMDGWETLEQLKLDESSRDIPVVILSARAEPKEKVRALRDGAVDYIVKPFSVRDSMEKIRTILGQEEQAREEAPPAGEDQSRQTPSTPTV